MPPQFGAAFSLMNVECEAIRWGTGFLFYACEHWAGLLIYAHHNDNAKGADA
jgi:hypothetical protein